METTRHFVATVYVVNEGKTALHFHDRLDMWLPPGGHIERDELPHQAAKREVSEELGIEVELVSDHTELDSASARTIPQPHHMLVEDITVHEDGVSHQHIDLVYFGSVPHKAIDPADGEVSAEEWTWYTADDLLANQDRFASDVIHIGREAIETIG